MTMEWVGTKNWFSDNPISAKLVFVPSPFNSHPLLEVDDTTSVWPLASIQWLHQLAYTASKPTICLGPTARLSTDKHEIIKL